MAQAREQSDSYQRPMGAATPINPLAPVFDLLEQSLDRSERALGIVREQRAAEQRVLDEAHAPRTAEANDPSIGDVSPIGFADSRLRRVNAIPSVVIFDDAITLGLIANLAAEMELDGLKPCVRWHRNERGDIRGIEIARIVEEAA